MYGPAGHAHGPRLCSRVLCVRACVCVRSRVCVGERQGYKYPLLCNPSSPSLRAPSPWRTSRYVVWPHPPFPSFASTRALLLLMSLGIIRAVRISRCSLCRMCKGSATPRGQTSLCSFRVLGNSGGWASRVRAAAALTPLFAAAVLAFRPFGVSAFCSHLPIPMLAMCRTRGRRRMPRCAGSGRRSASAACKRSAARCACAPNKCSAPW